MAEVFSTIAGVASLIDVALRACNVLYDSSRYLKDAPLLSQRLRRTVQSVESALQSLKQFVTQYRQQQVSAGLPDHLPGAVNDEIISIKVDLDTLSALLPASSSNGQLRTKFKWVLDRKKVAEILQALDSHQITLLFALQSFAQRKGIEIHSDLVGRLDQLGRRHEDTAKNLREELISGNAKLHADLTSLTQTSQALSPAQESLGSRMTDLHKTVSAGETTILDSINALGTSLSHTHIRSNHVQSSTVLTVPTEDVLARVFRAELQQVIMPNVQQCFDTFKASSGSQLDEIRQQIDQMAQQLGSRVTSNEPRNVKQSLGTPQAKDSVPTHFHQDPTDLTTPLCFVTNQQSHPQSRQYQKWSYSWVFYWRIGMLRVTISTSVTKRNMSPDYRAGGYLSPEKSVRVNIQFVPAQRLIQCRGLEMSVATKSDQRGFYQICPFISTFAVVPWDADVFEFVRANDVKGIQDLFQRGLAAPSDRSGNGWTPLMEAVYNGSVDTCRFLLSQGSDPLAVNQYGVNATDCAVIASSLSLQDGKLMAVIRLLQLTDSYTIDATSHSQKILIHGITKFRAQYSCGILELLDPLDLLYCQQLRPLGYRLDTLEDGTPAIFMWIYQVQLLWAKLAPEGIRRMLQTLLGLGADICARWSRCTPLYYLFDLHRRPERSAHYHNTIETAIVLLDFGADLYALNDDGLSVFDVAEYYGWSRGLVLALQRAGYDAEKVGGKVDRAQWYFDNPGYGLGGSTAVDTTQIGPTSTVGLRSRTAVPEDRLDEHYR